jgi:hypothetical protein
MPVTVWLGRGPDSAAIADFPEGNEAAKMNTRSDRRKQVRITWSSATREFTG